MAEPQRKSPRADAPEGFTTSTDTPTQTPDARAGGLSIAEAARFLEILGEGEDVWWFRALADARANDLRPCHRSGVWEGVAPLLDELSREGFALFFVVNAGGRKAEQIDRVRAVFVDLDGAPLGPVLACALEPHAVVETSPGHWHAYWVTDGLDLRQFETVQRAIAARFDGDPTVHDLPRVMRLPGSWHRKTDTPHRVRIVHESGAQPYSAERVLAEFLGNGPAVASPARSAAPASLGSVPAGVRHMPDAQRVELFDALRFLAERGSTWSPDDRSAWVRVGMALKEFGQAGLEIWTEWSRQSSKFDEVDQRRTWATLKPATGTNHLRVESIFLAAHALGWSAPATKENLPAPRKPALRVFDRYTKHEPTRFAVDRIFPRRAVTLWSGHGGVGKSTLLLGACACFAASTSWFGLAVEGGRALYLSLEDEGATVAERLDRLIPAYDLDPDRVYPNLTMVDAPESTRAALISECYSDRGGLTVERTETFFELREMARGHDLIVIDGLSDAFDFEINTGRYSKKAIAALTDLARECNAAVVLVCHVNRQTVQQGTRGHSYAGSAALHNAARSRVAIIRDQRSGEAVTLEHEKSNYGPLIQPLEITVSTEGVPRLADIDHVPDITAEARTCAAAIVAKSDAEHILAAMRAAIAQGERVSAARTGPKTAQHVLATFDELPTDLRGRSGRERFWRGWDRLVKDGRVAVIEERDRYRNLVRIATPTTTPEAYANAKDGGGA